MKSFSEFISEDKTVFDYLLFPPQGKELEYAMQISKMKNSSKYVYRGISRAEYKSLKKHGKVVSKGVGNTRKGMTGSYVSDDIQLAGRFALRAWKDTGGAYILTIERKSLPDITPADPGNYFTSFIPLNSVKKTFELK